MQTAVARLNPRDVALYAAAYDLPHVEVDCKEIQEDLEAAGWREWLLTLFPFWFEENFSDDHIKYWDLRWSVVQRIKNKQPVPPADLVAMLLLGRGLGKSACLEAGAVMRAALLGSEYVLFISETDDQAAEHLGNVKTLIEHPESRLVEYYPKMAIAENASELRGIPTADRRGMFVCKNGAIFRAKGLTAKMRGLRVGVRRPSHIILDDVDDVSDSLAVSVNKERQITASILPVQARENVTIDVGQNLITVHSVVNRIFTGKSDALAERTIIGVTNAFSHLDVETYFDEEGRIRHRILPTSVPSWDGLNIAKAQKFLNDSGLETFKAEYQNEFEQFKTGRVIKEYDEAAQVITWSMFEKVFGERRIPAHWRAKCGLDVGYTEGQNPHFSAWVFVATAAMNSALPGTVFLYRSRSFKGVSIDDQAEAVKAAMLPGENVTVWQMSHERTGEMLTLQQQHKIPFQKFDYFGAEDGVAQWRHMSKRDRLQPHPFKPDEMQPDGTYKLGRPNLFYIVDDMQAKLATDDAGHRLFREQVAAWEYVPVKITDSGQTVQKPSKLNDDMCDSFKGIIALWGPRATPLTPQEEFEQMLPKEDVIDWSKMKAEQRAPTLEEQTRNDFAIFKAQQQLLQKYGHGRDEEEW